jgi:hypothetical protein
MRGGYRPGSGPRKGKKYKPRALNNLSDLLTNDSKLNSLSKLTPEEREDIRRMLSWGERLMDGGKLSRAEIKQLDEMGERFGPLTRAEKSRRGPPSIES